MKLMSPKEASQQILVSLGQSTAAACCAIAYSTGTDAFAPWSTFGIVDLCTLVLQAI